MNAMLVNRPMEGAEFGGGGLPSEPERVLFIGDLAVPGDLLEPVTSALEEEFGVDPYAITLDDAVQDPDTMAMLAQDAHVLGHGMASVAIARIPGGMRSVTMVAGLETAALPSGIRQGEHPLAVEIPRPLDQNKILQWRDSPPEGMNRMMATREARSLLLSGIVTTDLSTRAILDILCQGYNVPALNVTMERDELGHTYTGGDVTDAGVRLRHVTGPETSHDYLLLDPVNALKRGGFRNQLRRGGRD